MTKGKMLLNGLSEKQTSTRQLCYSLIFDPSFKHYQPMPVVNIKITMRKLASITALFMLSISLSGCGLVEGAFKAGVIFALIIIAIIGLVIWLAHITGRYITRRYNVSWEDDDRIG